MHDGCGTEPLIPADSKSKEEYCRDRYAPKFLACEAISLVVDPPKFDLESYIQNYRGMGHICY
jgi:hypothetical protein